MKLSKKMITIISIATAAVVILLVILLSIFLKPHNHEYSDPTCTTAATCTICGVTDGLPLGHTTQFGKCEVCGELQGKELYTQIATAFDKVNQNIVAANVYVNANTITSITSSGSNVTKSFDLINEDKEEIDAIVTLCADIPELEGLKTKLEAASEVFPEKPVDSTPANLTYYIGEYQKYVKAVNECSIELADIALMFI